MPPILYFTIPRCNVPVMLAAQWDVSASLLDGEDLVGMAPTLFPDNPAAAEVAFLADHRFARKDVDRINRALFQPELVTAAEAIQICRKPRPGKFGF